MNFYYYGVASQGRITLLTALFYLQNCREGSGDQEGFARRWISYWSKGWIQSLLALFFLDNILIYIWISLYWTIILRCCLLGVLGFMASINGLVTGWESSGANEPFLGLELSRTLLLEPKPRVHQPVPLGRQFARPPTNSRTMQQAHRDTWTTTQKDTAMFSGNTNK